MSRPDASTFRAHPVHFSHGFRRHLFGLLLSLAVLLQPACFWKLWSKEKPLEERRFDVYGTVESITPNKLVIQTRRGPLEFDMVDSSIKGSDFKPGAYVHVYYRIQEGNKQVTMVVERVNR